MHIRYDKCTRRNCSELTHCPAVKDQWDCVLSVLKELGEKEFLALTNQYNNEFFLVASASCHCTLPHFIRSMLELRKIVPKIILLISRIQSLHLLLEVDDHDEVEHSVVLTLGKRYTNKSLALHQSKIFHR